MIKRKINTVINSLNKSDFNLNPNSWKYYQEWNDCIFLHFKVPFKLLTKLIPKDIELDSFDSNYYVSLVAFTMNEIHPRYLLPISNISNFHEINIRTYVKKNGQKGVYFINIEAQKVLSSWIAKLISKLPYEKSIINRNLNYFNSFNHNKNFSLNIKYNVKNKFKKSDFEVWLLERYYLFNVSNSILYKYDIYHSEWEIKNIDLTQILINYKFGDLILNMDNIISYHYSIGVNVLSWSKEKII